VALIQPVHENQVGDKHVESLLLPRLDAGSTPASSTNKRYYYLILRYLIALSSVINQHLVNERKITPFLTKFLCLNLVCYSLPE
jgi:hypothetical protein